MFYYDGLTCPVCHKAFSSEDDVVACPHCGLPHHRACWNSIGHCFEADNHGTTQQWTRDKSTQSSPPNEAPSVDANASHNVCPQCQMNNTEYAEFCSRCGHPLHATDWHSAGAPVPPPVGEYTHYNTPFGSAEVYSSSERIGSASASELAAVVGNNTQYYIQRFRRIESGGGGGWNWPAFLLGPFWLFYRKQYALGALYFAVLMISNISFAILYAPVQFAQSEAAMESAMEKVMSAPMFVPILILSLLFFALKVLLGIRGNLFYMRHCEKKISTAKEKIPDVSTGELASAGGVSVGMGVLSYVVSSLIIEIVTILSM